MKNSYIAVSIIMILALAGVGYVIWSGYQDDTDNVIKIGATVSLSGSYSTEGSRVLNGYQLAIKDINDAGGIDVDGKQYKLKLVYYDDASDKTTAAQLYDTLITSDKVNVLLGPYSSSIVLSVAPVAEAAKIPFVQASGASDSIYEQGFEYVFGLYRVGSSYSFPLFDWLGGSGHLSDVVTVAAFIEDDSFTGSVWGSDDTVPGAQKYIKDAGLTLKSENKYASGSYDEIGTAMTVLKSSGGADIIMTMDHYADAKRVVDEIDVNNLSPKVIFGTVGVPETKFVDELGTKANGAMGFAQWVTNIPNSAAPGITDFIADYEAKHSETPAYHAAGGYAAVQVVAAAIEDAGTFTDGSAIRDALANIDVNTTKLNIQQIVRKGITRIFQLVQVIPELTVLENVMVGALNGRSEVVSYDDAVRDSLEALSIIGMRKYTYKLMKSLVLTERKKIKLARVLTTKPKVILLDEIIAGLNPSETDEMLSIIKKLNEELGITIIFVEHVMKAVMSISHRIVVLNYGKLIADGTPKEISQDARVINAYLGTEIVDKYVENK